MDECTEERRRLAAEFSSFREAFIAMGDETRQQIFVALLESEGRAMRVGELTEKTHLSRPAVSHHLQILRRAGLVDVRHAGTMNFYYVSGNRRCWAGLKRLFDDVYDVASAGAKADWPRLEEE